jgi:hypothetical protein
MGANDSFGGILRSAGDYSDGKSGFGLSPVKGSLKPVSIDGAKGQDKQAAFDTKSVGGRTNKSENFDDKTVQELDELIEGAEKEI